MVVHQLSSQNFKVVGRNKKTLNLNIGGYVLVFFKMQNCAGCKAFEPQFHNLASMEQRVKFAILDVGQFTDVAARSRSTTTSIQSVPYILLYVNGVPMAHYTGKKNMNSIQSFLTKILSQAPPPSGNSEFMSQSRSVGGYGAQPPNYGAPSPQQGKVYTPETDSFMMNKGTNSMIESVESEDDQCLITPDKVTPHNNPWETMYHKMG